jgi:hypothetical protein
MTDPLAQLRDIHLPNSTGFWPLAWGWWLLLAVIVGASLTGLYAWHQQRRKNRYRLLASAELDSALQQLHQHRDSALYLQDLAVILRRTALVAFPEPGVAGMRGLDWLAFLDATLADSQNGFTQGVGRVLLSGPYQLHPQVDADALHELAQRWVREHKRKPARARREELREAAHG